MKTRRISTRRIGTDSKSCKRGWKREKVFFSVLAAIAIVLVFVYDRWLPDTRSIVQITVIATTSPLPTATQLPSTPTALPVPSPVVAPSPAPSPVKVYGVALGDVWLRRAPGGERLPAAVLKGQRVEILDSDSGYLKVCRSDGETVLAGWVTARWIEVQ